MNDVFLYIQKYSPLCHDMNILYFMTTRYELALECAVEGGDSNSTLSWWVAGVKYDSSIDKIIGRDPTRNKRRKIINRILYR